MTSKLLWSTRNCTIICFAILVSALLLLCFFTLSLFSFMITREIKFFRLFFLGSLMLIHWAPLWLSKIKWFYVCWLCPLPHRGIFLSLYSLYVGKLQLVRNSMVSGRKESLSESLLGLTTSPSVGSWTYETWPRPLEEAISSNFGSSKCQRTKKPNVALGSLVSSVTQIST